MFVVLRALLFVAQLNAVGLDSLAHHFKVGQTFFKRLAGEHQGEFLTAIAVSLASAPDLAQLSGNQAQHLITDIVTMGVVEFLEVINVGHGDHVTATQALQALIQGTSPR